MVVDNIRNKLLCVILSSWCISLNQYKYQGHLALQFYFRTVPIDLYDSIRRRDVEKQVSVEKTSHIICRSQVYLQLV